MKWEDVWPILFGAGLALLGGAVGTLFQQKLASMARRREREEIREEEALKVLLPLIQPAISALSTMFGVFNNEDFFGENAAPGLREEAEKWAREEWRNAFVAIEELERRFAEGLALPVDEKMIRLFEAAGAHATFAKISEHEHERFKREAQDCLDKLMLLRTRAQRRLRPGRSKVDPKVTR